jgi:hypothetical protein
MSRSLPSLQAFRQRFIDAMDDDFNTPEALGRAPRPEPGAAVGRGGRLEASAGAQELKTLAGALGLHGPRRRADERASTG